MTENGSISYWGCPHCLSWDSEESPGKNFCLTLWSMIKVYQLNIQTTLTWKTVINISYSLLMISSSSIKLRNIYLQWPICDTRDQSQCAPRPHVWNHHLISSVLWTVQCLHALICGPTPVEAGLNNIPFQRQGKQVFVAIQVQVRVQSPSQESKSKVWTPNSKDLDLEWLCSAVSKFYSGLWHSRV